MRRKDASWELTRWQHFSVWNDVMAAILKYYIVPKIRLCQSMHTYLKNTLAEIHPNVIGNNGALGFFWRGHPNKNNKKEEQQDE